MALSIEQRILWLLAVAVSVVIILATTGTLPSTTPYERTKTHMQSWDEILTKYIPYSNLPIKLTPTVDDFYICFNFNRIYQSSIDTLYSQAQTDAAIDQGDNGATTACASLPALSHEKALCITRHSLTNSYGSSQETAINNICAKNYLSVGNKSMWDQWNETSTLTSVCLAYCDPEYYYFTQNCSANPGTWTLSYNNTANILSGTCNATHLVITPNKNGYGIEFPVKQQVPYAFGSPVVDPDGSPLSVINI